MTDTRTICRHCKQPIRLAGSSWRDGVYKYSCGASLDDGPHEPELRPVIGPEITATLDRGARDSAWVARQVDRDYRREIARLKAQIALIEQGVSQAYSHDWAPSQRTVFDAVFPGDGAIRARMERDGWDEDA